MALLIRAELTMPGLQFLNSNAQYNQMFTMHGSIMLLLFATPIFVGFGNVIMPLQIGAPDVAFPRLNMFGYYAFLFGGIIVMAVSTPSGAADFGWFAYAPLSLEIFTPSQGADMWILGFTLGGLGTILSAVNFITTIVTMRPGMRRCSDVHLHLDHPADQRAGARGLPRSGGVLVVLETDRKFGTVVFEASNGGAILWQHLFWFFGHQRCISSLYPSSG